MFETFLDHFFSAITQLGSELFYMIFLPPIFWCLNKKFGFRLFYITLLAGYIAALVKNITETPRPPKSQWKIKPYATGFPSGHAQGVTTLWGLLIVTLRNRLILIFGITLIVLVSISRLYLGVHYPIDVVGGILIGIALILGYIVFEPKLSSKINKLNFYHKLTIAGLVPIILGIVAYVTLQEDTKVILGAGTLLGASIGYVIECETTNFVIEGNLAQKILRAFIGFIIAFSIYFSLFAVLPGTIIWLFIIGFIGGFNVTFTAPAVFYSIEKHRIKNNRV